MKTNTNITYSNEYIQSSQGLSHIFLYVIGPPLPPSKPVASRVTPTSVKLKWNPPEHDGHSIVTSYFVEQLREGFGEWQPIVQQPKAVFVVKTLNPNTWYQFRVIACNDNGESRASEPSEIVSTAKGKGLIEAV